MRAANRIARKLLPEIWASTQPLWLKAVMTLQICQFGFYLLAGLSAAISLALMALGAVYLSTVAALGLAVTALGIGATVSYLYMGQAMLGREQAPYLARALLLAIIFPSGLVLANTRATFEAFSGAQMEFVRTPKSGARMSGSWRGRPELLVGLLLPAFTFIEQAWSAPFFAVAAAGLLSIGAMGWSGANEVPARETAPGLPPAE